MANILDAAKWMKQGHPVCSGQRRGIYAQEETGAFFTDSGGVRIHLDLDDLLDESWQLLGE